MKATLIYDGECPLCSRYVKMTRLQEHVDLRLVDAREPSPDVDTVRKKGLVLDNGLILVLEDAVYHGSAALSMLAMLTTPSSAFNRFNAAIFRSPTVARVIYPFLVTGRNILLRLLGRKKLGF